MNSQNENKLLQKVAYLAEVSLSGFWKNLRIIQSINYTA